MYGNPTSSSSLLPCLAIVNSTVIDTDRQTSQCGADKDSFDTQVWFIGHETMIVYVLRTLNTDIHSAPLDPAIIFIPPVHAICCMLHCYI